MKYKESILEAIENLRFYDTEGNGVDIAKQLVEKFFAEIEKRKIRREENERDNYDTGVVCTYIEILNMEIDDERT